jgi:hypothetical protein
MAGTAVYWLLVVLAALIAYAVYVGIRRETRRAARLELVAAQRTPADIYWSTFRTDAYCAAILVTARAHPERLEELVAS